MAELRLAEAPLIAKPAAAHAGGYRRAGCAARRGSARHHPGHAVGRVRAALPDAKKAIQATAAASTSAGVYAINEQLWAKNEDPQLIRLLGVNGLKSYRSGATLYNSVCFACHGPMAAARRCPAPRAVPSHLRSPIRAR